MLTFSFTFILFQAFIFQFFCTFTHSLTLPSTDNTRSWEFTLYLKMTEVNLVFGWKRCWLLHSFLYFDKDFSSHPQSSCRLAKHWARTLLPIKDDIITREDNDVWGHMKELRGTANLSDHFYIAECHLVDLSPHLYPFFTHHNAILVRWRKPTKNLFF